jgi:hypothetical protein
MVTGEVGAFDDLLLKHGVDARRLVLAAGPAAPVAQCAAVSR